MCAQGHIKLLFSFQNQKSQYQSQCLRLMMVSISVSIFYTTEKNLSINLNLWDQVIKSQSQNLTPTLKVSVLVSKIETGTGYTKSQSQNQKLRLGTLSLSINMQELVLHIPAIKNSRTNPDAIIRISGQRPDHLWPFSTLTALYSDQIQTLGHSYQSVSMISLNIFQGSTYKDGLFNLFFLSIYE